MKPIVRFTIVSVALTSLTVFAQESKVSRSALPAAVEKALQTNLNGATVKAFATEVESGKKVFEAETVLNGHTRDLQFATDGTLNEVEEEVTFDALSSQVQKALTTKAAGAKITKVESLTKQGRLVAYEAATLKGAKKAEVQVGPMGETLKHEE